MPPPAILLSDAARPFLNHMAENPDDLAARLVLCDWLQESGEEEFAEAMRRSIRTGEWVVFSREEPESLERSLR